MQDSPLSSAHVDYLQGIGAALEPPAPGAGWTVAVPGLRRLAHIRAVGGTSRHRGAPGDRREAGPRAPDPDSLLIGVHGYHVPVAFLVLGDPAGVSIHLGTWAPASAAQPSGAAMDARQGLAVATLRSLFPLVEAAPVAGEVGRLDRLPHVGLALGIPGLGGPQAPPETEAPLDRVIRAMGDLRWAVLVLAQPVEEAWAAQLRQAVINEMRAVRAAEQAQLAPSPLGEHYTELLKTALKNLTVGHSVGMWRTAAYLFGDAVSFYRLGSVWRATFDNERSLPEAIRILDLSAWPVAARRLIESWAMPDSEAPPGPGLYRRPLAHQSLLNSLQLARYLHLPREETPGFAIRLVPAFDVVPADREEGPSVELGRVVHRTMPSRARYRVRTTDLARHVFVAGVTGSGKTNTLFHLLVQAAAGGVPFLVLEPAKTEYRALLASADIGSRVRVFTAGREDVSPFRLNPFEAIPGTSVSQHLDLLRAVFAASFGMWTPLPQVLERCLHEVYVDRGWDLTTGENGRISGGDPAPGFPTLSELLAKVREVVPNLGYEERVTNDIEAALVTRLESLRRGGKGRMLDVRRSTPLEELLTQPCVIELEWMGDDDDKAFLMALLLTRLVEHRRAQGRSATLRHLLVVEEAHRLLAAIPPRTSDEQADPRGRAVETFTQLLAEVRAYGQGVVVADQVPVRLAPEVIKNTVLKLAHRTVAADDRESLAGAMAMDEEQARSLTVLRVGEAAVFGEGDDAPLLVQVDRFPGSESPGDDVVTARMRSWREGTPGAAFEISDCCAETCAGAPEACETARRLIGDEPVRTAFARTVLSTIAEPGALDRLWKDVADVLAARRPPGVEEEALQRAFAGHASEWLAERRGAQGRWTYARTAEFAVLLRRALLERLAGTGTAARDAFRRHATGLHVRSHQPYPACDLVCGDGAPPPCLYRHAVADLVASGRHQRSWRAADHSDAGSEGHRRVQTWEVCQDAGYDLVEFPETDWPEDLRQRVTAGARRACLCFLQQVLAAEAGLVPRTARRVLAKVLEESGV